MLLNYHRLLLIWAYTAFLASERLAWSTNPLSSVPSSSQTDPQEPTFRWQTLYQQLFQQNRAEPYLPSQIYSMLLEMLQLERNPLVRHELVYAKQDPTSVWARFNEKQKQLLDDKLNTANRSSMIQILLDTYDHNGSGCTPVDLIWLKRLANSFPNSLSLTIWLSSNLHAQNVECWRRLEATLKSVNDLLSNQHVENLNVVTERIAFEPLHVGVQLNNPSETAQQSSQEATRYAKSIADRILLQLVHFPSGPNYNSLMMRMIILPCRFLHEIGAGIREKVIQFLAIIGEHFDHMSTESTQLMNRLNLCYSVITNPQVVEQTVNIITQVIRGHGIKTQPTTSSNPNQAGPSRPPPSMQMDMPRQGALRSNRFSPYPNNISRLMHQGMKPEVPMPPGVKQPTPRNVLTNRQAMGVQLPPRFIAQRQSNPMQASQLMYEAARRANLAQKAQMAQMTQTTQTDSSWTRFLNQARSHMAVQPQHDETGSSSGHLVENPSREQTNSVLIEQKRASMQFPGPSTNPNQVEGNETEDESSDQESSDQESSGSCHDSHDCRHHEDNKPQEPQEPQEPEEPEEPDDFEDANNQNDPQASSKRARSSS